MKYLLACNPRKQRDVEERGRERDRGRRKEEPFSFCNPKLLSVLQCAASKWSGWLPAPVALCWQRSTARTPSRVLPPTVLKIFLSPSAPSLPLSPVLSLSSPSHALTKHITLSLVMLARLYLFCKVRCKVLHCLSFLLGKKLWTWDPFIGLRMFGTHISFLFLDYSTNQSCFCIFDICSAK